MKTSVLFILSFVALFSIQAVEKAANIQFKEEVHDFGTIVEGNKPSYNFVFTNTGDAPLVIVDVDVSCGCTEPEFPEEAIMPGQTGIIKIGFNSTGKSGRFDKSVTVKSNAKDGAVRLRIVGNVSAK